MSYIQSLFTGMSLALIVPCYNEENRLSVAEVEKLAGMEDVRVFLVNDCSTDNTLELIEGIAANNSAISVINYKQNQGKAATIFRAYHDINHENTLHTSYYGFLDADFSTTADAFLELYKFILNHNETEFIFASRIATLNSAIKRHVHRHYIGRILITLLNLKYHLGIYDTQCGAKIFGADIAKIAFEKAFVTQWLFDIEIFLRLRAKNRLDKGFEFPLQEWRDVAGSKLAGKESVRILGDIYRLLNTYE